MAIPLNPFIRPQMELWILSVRDHRYHPNRRLLEAAGLLRQKASLVHPGRLYLGIDGRELVLKGGGDLRPPDILLPRIGATIKEFGLTAIRHFQLMGVSVVNGFEAILLSSNKFLSMQTLAVGGIPVLETRYASNRSNFGDALASLGGFPIIVKLSSSRQGSGVHLFDSMDKAMPTLEEQLDKGHGILMQRFIPPEERRDFRVLVGRGEVLGAMSLKPRPGEFRSNVHLGGVAEPVEASGEMASLALRSAEALGLDIAGVDMVQDDHNGLCVIEVNSTPGFKGLETCTGKDIATAIIRCSLKGMGNRV